MESSLIASLASLPEADRAAVLADLTEEQAEELLWDWRAWARPEQIAPDGDWSTWLVLAGRGFGKTRTGAEWIKEEVESGRARRIALIAETAKDARDVIVEGESGLLSIYPEAERPVYEPSKARVTFANGAVATLYNGTEPDQLRGPQFDAAWVDELAKYRYPRETWDMLQFGLRLGSNPRQIVTTTPRPIPLIKELVADPMTVVTRGSSYDNLANLAPSFIAKVRARYEGTRLGRQELNAEILDDLPGALWTRATIDDARVTEAPDLTRIVVAIDPSGSGGEAEDGDEIGIVVAGKGVDGRGYVLADKSCRLSPDGWGRRAVAAYHEFSADRVIAERNFGGAMVGHVIRTIDGNVPYGEVTASRGKIVRAEPVAALYEQGRVSHVGSLPDLEDQMCLMAPEGYAGEGSPDRADALVWALTDLMLGSEAVYPAALVDVLCEPFAIPPYWRRGYAMEIGPERTAALWGAEDPVDGVLYLYAEHCMGQQAPAIDAAAIKARGDWITGAVNPLGHGRKIEDGRVVIATYAAQGLRLVPTLQAQDAGISEVWSRLQTGRIRIFSTLRQLQAEYRLYRRDEHGNVVKEHDLFMNAFRHLVMTWDAVARVKPAEGGSGQPSGHIAADPIAGY